MRTKQLTEEIPSAAPRTVYRRARYLSELGLIDREEVRGVPSAVIHSLSPAGRDLRDVIESYEELCLRWGSGPAARGDSLWPRCELLGGMWGGGWIEMLSHADRSITELTEAPSALTFHQVNRLTHKLRSWGLLDESSAPGGRRRYQLSDRASHAAGLIAALGRWRANHVDAAGPGLTALEVSTILRVAMRLLRLPDHPSRAIRIGVIGPADAAGKRGSESFTAQVSDSGAVGSVEDEVASGWALATADAWIAAILDGGEGKIRAGGEVELVEDFLKQLHEVLWFRAAAEVEGPRP